MLFTKPVLWPMLIFEESKMDYKTYLTTDILDFWLENAIDEKEGGIFTQLDKEGKIYGTEKSVWFQGRALWTFAKAYNFVEKNQKYLNACHKIYSFLPRCGDENYRMAFTVTREGKTIQKRRYYFSETFAAIGCMEYYKATNNMEAHDKAEKYFDVAYAIYKDSTLTTPKYQLKQKALSPVMIMLATAQVMRSGAKNPEKYNVIAKEMLDEIINGGYLNATVGALLETVSSEGEFVNTPSGRVVNPGHSLEAAWFLISEGVFTGNEVAVNTGKKIIDITMESGLDQKNGGVIAFRDALGYPPVALEWDMKLWWPQCEGIIANLMAYKVFGEEKYKKNYKALMQYAIDNFADKENGEWYGYLHYDNTPSNYLKGNIFKGPFHLPRMLMIVNSLENGETIEAFLR